MYLNNVVKDYTICFNTDNFYNCFIINWILEKNEYLCIYLNCNILHLLKCYVSSTNLYIFTVTKFIIMNEGYKHK